jgi:hypothetical protein
MLQAQAEHIAATSFQDLIAIIHTLSWNSRVSKPGKDPELSEQLSLLVPGLDLNCIYYYFIASFVLIMSQPISTDPRLCILCPLRPHPGAAGNEARCACVDDSLRQNTG